MIREIQDRYYTLIDDRGYVVWPGKTREYVERIHQTRGCPLAYKFVELYPRHVVMAYRVAASLLCQLLDDLDDGMWCDVEYELEECARELLKK